MTKLHLPTKLRLYVALLDIVKIRSPIIFSLNRAQTLGPEMRVTCYSDTFVLEKTTTE